MSSKRCECGREVIYTSTGECRACYRRRRRHEDPAIAARDRRHSQAWKERNRDLNRERDRERDRARRRAGTVTCGCGAAFIRPDEEMCGKCRRRATAQTLYDLIERMWNDGASLREIAAATGKSVGYVSGSIAAMRDQGRNLSHRYRAAINAASNREEN